MKIYEIRLKSSDDKKPDWTRAKVSIGVAGPPLFIPASKIHAPNLWKSEKSINIHKICENLWNTMKVFRWQEASLDSSRGFYGGSRSPRTGVKDPCPKSIKITEIHRNPLISMNMLENLWNSMKVLRWQEASLDSSKGFCKGSRSRLTGVKAPCP